MFLSPLPQSNGEIFLFEVCLNVCPAMSLTCSDIPKFSTRLCQILTINLYITMLRPLVCWTHVGPSSHNGSDCSWWTVCWTFSMCCLSVFILKCPLIGLCPGFAPVTHMLVKVNSFYSGPKIALLLWGFGVVGKVAAGNMPSKGTGLLSNYQSFWPNFIKFSQIQPLDNPKWLLHLGD